MVREPGSDDADVVRKAFAANNAGDIDGFIHCLDPEVEWDSPGLFLYPPATRHGRDQVREALLRGMHERGGLERVTLSELSASSGEVLVIGTVSTPTARRPVTLPIAWIVSVRDGLVARVRGFRNESAARGRWVADSAAQR